MLRCRSKNIRSHGTEVSLCSKILGLFLSEIHLKFPVEKLARGLIDYNAPNKKTLFITKEPRVC